MELLSAHQPVAGFYAAEGLAAPPGSIGAGSKNYLFPGGTSGRGWKGLGASLGGQVGARVMFQTPTGYAGLGDAAQAGIGAVIGAVAKALLFIGQGNLTINGVTRAVLASTALQILLYRSGSYSGAGTGPFTAGIDPPTAPTIAEHSVTTSTVNSGTTSAVIWFVRSATGGRSRKSLSSNVLTVTGKKVRLTVAAGDLVTAAAIGADRIGIGLPQWGFGATGPHYEEREIAISSLTTVDGVANSVELEWSSASLAGKPFAPIDDYPPPAGVFACLLEDVMAVIGCYGDPVAGVAATTPGTAIAVSLPVLIESFPPDNLLFLPEPPVGVLPRPSQGFCYIGCANSVHALSYTGGQVPLSLQTVFASIGIAHQNNMTAAEGGRLYLFSNGKQGMVRIGERGQPETEWAAPVADYVKNWTAADVVVGWDNDTQSVVFGHDKILLAFNTQTGRWSAPLDLTGTIGASEKVAAMVTVSGTLHVSFRDTVTTATAQRLSKWADGSGTNYELYLPWTPAAAEADEVFEIEVALVVDQLNPVTVRILANGDPAAIRAEKTATPVRTGLVHLPTFRVNARGLRSHTVYVRQFSPGAGGVEGVRVRGVRSGVTL